ncbi:DUF4245 domain-containing protein [Plantactinospora sp. B5E13]|uniref:DUF4245 domain-containing protein n=1 Tax=Plantactinospora sp. B5E13 TaxID=3153758 RepID=UPI00325E62FE
MDTTEAAGRTPDDRLTDEPGGRVGAPPAADAAAPDGSGADERQVVSTAIRSQRSTKDIVISLLVLLVPIALLIGLGRVFLGADTPTQVDPAPTVQQARAANLFPVGGVTGLDDDWRTVTADFRRGDTGATLRIGYLTPGDDGVQLVQSSVPAEQLLPAELTRTGQPQGAVEIGGRSWQRYSARAGELALVLLEPARTVIIVGPAPEDELRELAASLT